MGKTAAGAVWLDPDRTSPYDYYQFWVNTHDADVIRFLKLFTFLPTEEIARAKTHLSGQDLNKAKAVLAFEATALAHGEEAAQRAYAGACENFGPVVLDNKILPSSGLHQAMAIRPDPLSVEAHVDSVESIPGQTPTSTLGRARLKDGLSAVDLFHEVGLAASKGAARRLLDQGGGYVNGVRLPGADAQVTERDVEDGAMVLRAGKKRYHRVVLGD
jgi:tyrosyl-tRNA synthetase